FSTLWACRMVSAGEGIVEWEGERFRVPRPGRCDGEPVTVSVRPEKLTLLGSGTGSNGNRLAGVVEVVTFLGPFVRVEVGVRGRAMWLDVSHAAAAALARKQPVTVGFSPADCVVLGGRGRSTAAPRS